MICHKCNAIWVISLALPLGVIALTLGWDEVAVVALIISPVVALVYLTCRWEAADEKRLADRARKIADEREAVWDGLASGRLSLNEFYAEMRDARRAVIERDNKGKLL